MLDYVYRCIICNSIAYKVKKDENYILYECSDCGVQWEVVDCGRDESL